MKALLVTMYFPPAGGGGVQRPLKLAQYLPPLGIETHVLAPDDPKWVHSDPDLRIPTQAWVHRVRYLGPRAMVIVTQLSALFGVLFVVSGHDLWTVILCHGLYDPVAVVRFAGKKSKYSRLDPDAAPSCVPRAP